MVNDEEGVGGASVVGRGEELAVLDDALTGDPGGDGVIMVGGAGMGKTTLWDAAIGAAGARGVRVLAARSSGSEARLPFAGLIDLCDRVGPAEMRACRPRSGGVWRRCCSGRAAWRPAAGHGDRSWASGRDPCGGRSGPDLIAIDDVQWLDQPSADLLAFVARRLGEADVRFLLARRPGRTGALERVLVRQGSAPEVEGLSLGAVRGYCSSGWG